MSFGMFRKMNEMFQKTTVSLKKQVYLQRAKEIVH